MNKQVMSSAASTGDAGDLSEVWPVCMCAVAIANLYNTELCFLYFTHHNPVFVWRPAPYPAISGIPHMSPTVNVVLDENHPGTDCFSEFSQV